MKKMILFAVIALFVPVVIVGLANATTIIDNATHGFYNQSIGIVLDNTSSNFPGPNISTGDPTFNNINPAPDLSNASAILGGWLNDPPVLNSYWSPTAVSIPSTWAINTETAIVYEFDAGPHGLENVIAKFGVDNGIFVWLNGVYLNGWMAPGPAMAYEYTQNIGTLAAGTHYLQILREDHGGSTGYHINVAGDLVPAPVPEPGTMMLLGTGLAGLALYRRRMNKA